MLLIVTGGSSLVFLVKNIICIRHLYKATILCIARFLIQTKSTNMKIVCSLTSRHYFISHQITITYIMPYITASPSDVTRRYNSNYVDRSD